MQDITDTLDRTADCLRDLWNEYFYVGNDDMSSYPHEVQDLYEEAETCLFGALVLFKLDRLGFMAKYRTEAAPFLIVVPAPGPKPRLLVGRPSQDTNRYFDALDQRVGLDDVKLNLIEWFDWNRYGRRQFEYYFVTINTFPAHPEFEGRGALIERKNTRVFFDSNAG
ncbi:MAG TPA: hypothetical protein VKB36_14620 [Vicinamibacterales bacterium]|nr:hypothetical protein [Vicinamibacterales bacterium]